MPSAKIPASPPKLATFENTRLACDFQHNAVAQDAEAVRPKRRARARDVDNGFGASRGGPPSVAPRLSTVR